MTYKKIAKIANVSVSTVSKALSGSREISRELSQKIIEIAIACGYYKEKNKRKIEYAKNEAFTIAIICPEIISIAYARDITNIKKEVEARGGLTSVYMYDFDPDKLNTIIEMITVRGCADGIIIFPVHDFFTKSSIPIVAISSTSIVGCDTVSCDVDAYFDEMIKYLQCRGHTRIAFVGEQNTMIKLEAYKKSLLKSGLPFTEDDVYILDERFEKTGYLAGKKMLQRGSIPPAIICAYDEIALALIQSLSEEGVKIPDEVNILGINDIPTSRYAQIPLTTVRTFRNEQSAIAVNLLYNRIFDCSKAIQHITVGYELIKRQSTL